MKIEIEIWSTKEGKDGKPFCIIETVYKLDDEAIESKALQDYKDEYMIDKDKTYEARISKTIID